MLEQEVEIALRAGRRTADELEEILEPHHGAVRPLYLESAIAEHIQLTAVRHYDGLACKRMTGPQSDSNVFCPKQVHALRPAIHHDGGGWPAQP